MAWAEFEEREYESAALVELDDGALGPVWTPGQVLEKILGFDLVAQPDDAHPLWAVLRAPRPPGLRLVPTSIETLRYPQRVYRG